MDGWTHSNRIGHTQLNSTPHRVGKHHLGYVVIANHLKQWSTSSWNVLHLQRKENLRSQMKNDQRQTMDLKNVFEWGTRRVRKSLVFFLLSTDSSSRIVSREFEKNNNKKTVTIRNSR